MVSQIYRKRLICQNTNSPFFGDRDNVEWDEAQESKAIDSVSKNSNVILSEEELKRYEDEASSFWNSFYDIHQNKFFKDRHWLFTEFPELSSTAAVNDIELPNDGPRRIFEIGCGVGNTILPILKYNDDPNMQLFGCDFSSKAIDILANHEEFDSRRAKVFVLDATAEDWSTVVPFESNSLDIIVLIFVLSAIHPEK